KWLWNFSAGGSPSVAFVQNPDSVTYNNIGNYPISLTSVDFFGCSTTVSTPSPIIVTSPNAQFTLSKAAICLGDTLFVNNTSTPSVGLAYNWSLSNGMTSNIKTPFFVPIDHDTIDIRLVVDVGGVCFDTAVQRVIVEPAPVADFMVDGPTSSSCYPFIGVEFISTTAPIGYPGYIYNWNLGEGSSSDNDTSSTGYFEPGKFSVSLRVQSRLAGCVDSITKVDYIDVSGPSADFTISDSVVCVKDDILFKIDNKLNVDSFYWDFSDGIIVSGNSDSIYHSYQVTGTRIPVVVLQSGDCQIAIPETLFVNDVISRIRFPMLPITFTPGVDTIYACDSLNLMARFLPPVTGKVDRFFWDLGLGGPLNNTDTVVTQTYYPGVYEIYLAVGDSSSGCVDTLRQFIQVYNKPMVTAGPDQLICRGDSIQLVASGGSQYLWSPSIGLDRIDSAVVWTSASQSTSYRVTVTDAFGCVNSDTMNLTVDRSTALFSISTDTGCDSLVITPVNLSNATAFDWTLNGQTFSTQANPTLTISTPGVYIIALNAYELTPNCTRTATDTVRLFPSPIIAAPPPSLMCNGDSVILNTSINGTGTLNINWSPATGLSSTTINSPIAKPTVKTLYTITVTDDFCTAFDTVTVDVDASVADFDLADTLGCGSLTLNIQNNSVGNFYLWSFSNKPGDVATVPNPTYTYFAAGTYQIVLSVYDKDIRCIKYDTALVLVRPIPDVRISSLTQMCNYDSIQFVASGADFYDWSPKQDLNAYDIRDPFCFADSDGTWTVLGSDTFGCTDTAKVSVVVHPDYTYDVPQDDTLIIGQSTFIDLDPIGTPVNILWQSQGAIPCVTCSSNTLGPLDSTCYTVSLIDIPGCYPKTANFCLTIAEQYSLDVPSTFTPNGDGTNDIIYAKGYGIKKLIQFTIYNRFGEVVFETADMNRGWDGTYKGQIQSDETYIFKVSGETFRGVVLSKQGYISLLK
ncbi:MAG TPA: T9SS type B sorting domain-containing protein, partial [Luteibaculaceae bacterium]|nr:T9SS type B sorting domain-containing protein [Luteibaculaceae bacterium]